MEARSFAYKACWRDSNAQMWPRTLIFWVPPPLLLLISLSRPLFNFFNNALNSVGLMHNSHYGYLLCGDKFQGIRGIEL
jgi:hypothetical protein